MQKLENFIRNFVYYIKLKNPLNRQLFFWLVAFLTIFVRLINATYQGGNLSLFQLGLYCVFIFFCALFLIINFE